MRQARKETHEGQAEDWAKLPPQVLVYTLFLLFAAAHAGAQSGSPCIQSGTSVWNNNSIARQTSQFSVTFQATPSKADMNGMIGFSLNAANAATSLAATVRFANTGTIDARNGGSFSAAKAFPYTAGTEYQFQIAINPATKKYSVVVAGPGGTQVTLASNYAFRSSARVSSLNNWATYSTGGSETICNLTITAGGSPAVTAPTITTQPASQTVTAGQTAAFSVAASGTAPLSYQWAMNGTAISGANSASYTTPATTSANNGSQFAVTVSNSAGSVTSAAATLTVTSSPGTLSLSSSTLSFGSVNVGSSSALSATLTNSGGSSVTLSSVSISGAGFNESGASNGQIIAAGQAATVSVTFAPAATGSATGKVTIASNASNSPATISFSGTGTAASYSTDVSWTASTSNVIGYYVYRGTASGGPYTQLTPAAISTTNYTDTGVQAGETYYYVVTAVNSSGAQSADSNQASAVIP